MAPRPRGRFILRARNARFAMALQMRRIDFGTPDASSQLGKFRTQLGASGSVVSARGRELTIKVFGEPLPPSRVVERICEDVRKRGLQAVLHFTEQLDGARVTPEYAARHHLGNGAGSRRRRPALHRNRAPRPPEHPPVSTRVAPWRRRAQDEWPARTAAALSAAAPRRRAGARRAPPLIPRR